MNWQPGQAVEWHYTTHKGWGTSWWVPATVVKVNRKRITIDAKLTGGGTKRIHVSPEKLREKP